MQKTDYDDTMRRACEEIASSMNEDFDEKDLMKIINSVCEKYQ